jgi:3-methyladenine DNA glycosylase AlkD
MARFGIHTARAYGVSTPEMRRIAKEIGRDHKLASALWKTGNREARIIAGMIADPALVTAAGMDRWARQLDSWDVCDHCCIALFRKTPFAREKAVEWSAQEAEFVKRAGFALMATLAVHDKQANDAAFLRLLPVIERESSDDRNFVKKAVNWALRQIGKRNAKLRQAAIRSAERLAKSESRAARWIGHDALRELRPL